jgi:molybdopterin/thiamine biosynthesis adenylyltransferase
MRLLVEQIQRMRDEVRALDALVAELEWLNNVQWGMTPSQDVRVHFDFTVKGKVYEAELVYPSLFPEAPAYVRPRNQDEAWSAHRYPATGTLCLEWGPDNWHPSITGADLVRSTIKLLVYEQIGTMLGVQAPSRHDLTIGQRMRGEHSRFLSTPEFKAAIAASSRTTIPLVTATTGRLANLVALPTKVGEETDPPLAALPPEIGSADMAWVRNGWVVKVGEWSTLPTPCITPSAARDFLKAKGCWPWPDDAERVWFLVLVNAQGQLRPIAFSAGDAPHAYDYVVLEAKSDKAARLPERHAALAQKRVAIVGCGSLGSKVAQSLARSGVTRFYLVDDDVLMPDNLVRHQLDWLSVGHGKAEALKAAILLVRPDAEVQSKTFRFAGQESASLNMAVLEQVAACDLVIDATASPRVFSSIAAICARRKVACVWGEVFAGGIGALMARSLPGHDADPLTVRAAIHDYLADKPEAPFKRAKDYEAEANGEVLVAGDAEVSQLAASMTQFVVDALCGGTYRFPVPVYLLGFQQAWIFEAPFDTHPVNCPSPEAVDLPAQDVGADMDALEEVLSKFQATA